MRRSLLTLLVAAAVVPTAAEALDGLWTAVSAPGSATALHAIAGALRAAIALWVAVTILSWGDQRRDGLPLYDRRALTARLSSAPGRGPQSSTRGGGR
jgi:hypothetical protein